SRSDILSDVIKNKRITKAYAQVYKADPKVLQWAGLAAYVSSAIGKALRQLRVAAIVVPRPFEQGEPQDLFGVLAIGNYKLFIDYFATLLGIVCSLEVGLDLWSSSGRRRWVLVGVGRCVDPEAHLAFHRTCPNAGSQKLAPNRRTWS